MLTFKPVEKADLGKLREYYVNCNYTLCEYSAGTKLMWRHYLHPFWTEVAGCLVVCNTVHGRCQFDYPVAGPKGDIDAALTAMEKHCSEKGMRLTISVVPEDRAAGLLLRYPRVQVVNDRAWKDYVYLTGDLAEFAGRRYSGQRNHINKFRKEHPDARFIPLTEKDTALLEQFWLDYTAEFTKDSEMSRRELQMSMEMFSLLGTDQFVAGGLLHEGRLVAVSLAEKCGVTLINHIEKALYSHAGAYPAIVQAFAQYYGEGFPYINREDDARDRGLRTSKLQYLPHRLAGKMCFDVGSELDGLEAIPVIESQRLTLSAFTDEDQDAYNALCLDDERNRWWGYDYRSDLRGELTDDYFLRVAREDFEARRAVNWAVRLDGKCIGEAVLYNGDWKGGMELGCRIAPAYSGQGYGTEAFTAVANWALYRLGLAKVVAKCYHENQASHRMLSSCTRPVGQDETFAYFEKLV